MRELKETTLDVFTLLCLKFVIFYTMGLSLMSQSKSTRGFQDIEMRQLKLFNTILAGKMMGIWW